MLLIIFLLIVILAILIIYILPLEQKTNISNNDRSLYWSIFRFMIKIFVFIISFILALLLYTYSFSQGLQCSSDMTS